MIRVTSSILEKCVIGAVWNPCAPATILKKGERSSRLLKFAESRVCLFHKVPRFPAPFPHKFPTSVWRGGHLHNAHTTKHDNEEQIWQTKTYGGIRVASEAMIGKCLESNYLEGGEYGGERKGSEKHKHKHTGHSEFLLAMSGFDSIILMICKMKMFRRRSWVQFNDPYLPSSKTRKAEMHILVAHRRCPSIIYRFYCGTLFVSWCTRLELWPVDSVVFNGSVPILN